MVARNSKLLFYHMLKLLLLASCLSPIDFKVDNIGGRIVVSGQISSIAERNLVQVATIANTSRLPFPNSGASVRVFDDAGNAHDFIEDPQRPGDYRSEFAGVPGRSYHVQVVLASGEVLESTPELMPLHVGNDSVYHYFETEEFIDAEGTVRSQTFMKIYARSQLPSVSDPLYLRWSTDEVYMIMPTDFPDPFGSVPPSCFVTNRVEPQRIILYDGGELDAVVIPEQLVASRLLDQSFHTRHYFIVYQTSMTDAAFEYWRKVNVVANQVGSVFDAPPAQVSGNIVNMIENGEKPVGYFQAVNETFNRFYLVQGDLPYLLVPYCEYNPLRDEYPRECLDCLSVRNSTLKRPVWW